MRDRRHIGNRCNTDSKSCQRTNRRLPTRTWPFDFDIKIFNTLILCCTACHL